MENENVEENATAETTTADDGQNGGTSMTDAERAKKEKEKEKQRKKKEAKKEKEKEAKKDKDKDKGGKDGQKKDGDKKKKTPGDLIKEQLRKRQEEEERIRKEQEAEERRLEELEQQRLEKIRLEQERKQLKKQKEKEKIARLKKEGTYLKPEQKRELERQRKIIEMMKEQGIVVQGTENKETTTQKRPKYGDKKKSAKVKPAQENGQEATSHEPTPEPAGTVEEEGESEEAKGENVAESWDQLDVPETADKGEEEESSSDDEDKSSSNDGGEVDGPNGENVSIAPPPSQPSAPQQQQLPSSQSINFHESKEETRERILNRMKKRREEAMARRNTEVLRSPVICVLGHVDTGKTKILDKIRRTHVQDGEAGGITQQIGATMVPATAIKEQAAMVKDFEPELLNIPGFLIIDTPGHESFSNLRSRGSSLCDVAILVVDIMHGLEPQTLESLELLRKRNTPFVVALNKIDRLYEWKPNPHKDIRSVLKSQQRNCQDEFNQRVNDVKLQFAEQGMNVALFWENPDPNEYVSFVPTSAISGDGMGNLIASLVQYSQTQLKERITFCENLRCTILEVKVLPGLGTTIDVILVDGTLRVGDTIIVPGTEGPIVTQIRELLMPQPLREMRVKNPYEHFKEIKAAQGVKVLAKDLDKALAGLPLLVAQNEDEIELLKDEVSSTLRAALKSFTLSERGVYVQASTLGALEALLTFLKDQKIPYCGINIGPVHKRDVVKASTMLEHESQWAVILAFDVKIERDSQTLADELGVRIFSADIIYHLQDAYIKFRDEWKEKKRKENAHLAVYPVKLRVLPAHIFNARDPLVMGVMVEDGIAKIGTAICVPSKEGLLLGTLASMEVNNKPVDTARKGQEVCVKIENTTGDAPKMYGRHFDYQDILVSRITRESIDVMKTYFRDDLQKSDWQLIVELKKSLGVL